MARPVGSKNRVSFPTAQAPQTHQAIQSTQEAAAPVGNEIKRTYKEGAAVMEIPKSNSSAFLFPNEYQAEEGPQAPQEPQQPAQEPTAEKNVPRGTNEDNPSESAAQEPQPISEPQTDETIYLEDFLKKMNIDPSKVKTRTKVNGVENDVSIADVKKSYQLEQHLTKRGQQIGEERRQLESLRAELARAQAPARAESTGDPAYDALRQEMDQLRSLLPSLQPVIYQTARQSLDNKLKAQGYSDFMDYIDKIDARVGAEADEKKWNYYNTEEGATQLYFQMKLEDQIKGTPEKKQEPVKAQPRPPIVKIDGGNQPSRSNVDDWNLKYSELVTEWKKNPSKNKHLLQEILRMKDALYLK